MNSIESKKLKVHRDAIVSLIVILFVFILSVTGLIEPFELKVYDLLMKLKPATTELEDVVIVAIDDASIAEMGTFPWQRDKVADGIIRMRELGASSVTFDIEYTSPSALGVNPDAESKLSTKFNTVDENISSYIQELSDAIASGYFTNEEILGLIDEILNYGIKPEIQGLHDSVSTEVTRDNDEYFANSLAFFGNSWLTINVGDMDIKVSDELLDYVKENILLDNVKDDGGYIHPECEEYLDELGIVRGLTPALYSMLEKSAGAGFTNIVLDSDGTRRRVKLLFDEYDKYAAQLVTAPLLNIVKPSSIERTGNKLIFHDAMRPGADKAVDIVIPLDTEGNMLVNWIKQDFKNSFKYESFLFLKQLDDYEKQIINILRSLAAQDQFIDQYGDYLPFYSAAVYLLAEYDDITATKEELLASADATSREDPRFEEYFEARRIFFEECAELNDSYYMENIREFLVKYADEETQERFETFFTFLFDNYELYLEYYNEEFQKLHESYNNAFCIIGHTATASTDLGTTPFENHYANVGTHANVYNTIMTGEFITPVPWWYSVAAAALALLVMTFFSHFSRAFIQNLLGILGITICLVVCILPMVLFRVYIPVVPPFLIMILGYIACTVYRFIYAERDKKFLRSTLSTYVSADVVNEIVNDPAKLKLGGEEKNITAIFTDIRSFSTISEKVTPTELVSFLNQYLSLLSDIILENGGTIDKYEGDAIIAFVGAPVSYADHAWRACISAVRMKQAEAKFNEEMLANGTIPNKICMPICTRIGINTGDMVVGNMGTENKMNYTMMGNAVNLAARLEGVNKVYHSWVLVSETTWNAADSGEHKGILLARRLDKVRVVGINTPVQLYNILGIKSELDEALLESVKLFHQGLDLYLQKEFSNAKKIFDMATRKYPDDQTAAVFSARCMSFMEKGVPADWDGVVNMTSK
ncbi:MAG: adenylate/guanylate cyclase domain-containing protein [Treponemataceae bacterium]|nr:adenylate/guanylate cyclase domain-containing protein [Treponemataceae bacterium]